MLLIGPGQYSGACRSIGIMWLRTTKDDTPYLVYFLWGWEKNGEKMQESVVIVMEAEMWRRKQE